MSSAQSSTTNSNTTSVANSPSPSVATETTNITTNPSGLNSAEFTKEYLGTRDENQLRLIKKTCGFRKKTETKQEYVEAIYEWYQKNHVPKSATETPKTRKPRAKKSDNPVPIQTGTVEKSIRAEVALDAAGASNTVYGLGQGNKKERVGKMATKRPEFTQDELKDYLHTSSSTKEALKDRVHQIHNLLRNKGIGYGFNGLKFFNVLWGLKKLEDMNLLETLGLSEKCKFSTLHKLALDNGKNIGKSAHFAANANRGLLIGTVAEPRGIMTELYEKCREFLYYEMPRDIIPGDLCLFIREINSLAEAEKQLETKHQLAGKIYEYFIGRDDTAISEMGAYFTDRHIVNWIYSNLCTAELLDQTDTAKSNEFTIDTMNDPFGGSGGFTTGYIMRMNTLLEEKYSAKTKEEKKVLFKQFWETELLKVFHYDMNKDVLRAAALEFMCLTGTIPRTHERTQQGHDPNINYKNSFADNYMFLETNRPAKFKRIITNPPYGGDKISTTDNVTKNNLIRDYIQEQLKTPNLAPEEIARLERQIYALNELDRRERESLEEHKVKFDTCCSQLKDFIIVSLGMMEPVARQKFNDKESCSLALLMMLVDVGGEVIGVLKEGVFFDKKYADLRRKLIELYNVTDVISIPSNAFENTTTKTSILRFLNTPGQPTTTVKFGELDVEYFAANEFERTENGVVRLKNFAGEMKDDLVYRLVSQATREQILAQKDCALNGKEYANRDIIPNPGFKMVALGELCECKNGKQLDKNDMVPGPYNVYGGGDKIVGTHNQFNNENCIVVSGTGNYCGYTQYVNEKFWASQAFTVYSNDKIINKYVFYILKLLTDFIRNFANGSAQKFLRAAEFKNIKLPVPENPQVLADWVSRLSAAYNTRLTKVQQSKDLEQQVMTRIREIIDNEDCEEVKLGDICESKCGVKCNLQNYIVDNSEHIVLRTRNLTGSNDYMYINKDGYNLCLNSIVSKNDILMTAFTDSFITHKVCDNWVGHTFNGGLFRINNIKINVDYFNYSLNMNTFMEKLKHISGSSTASQFNTTKLMELKLKLPKNKQLITDLETVFTQIETLKSEAAEADKSYSGLLDELKRVAIKSMPVDSQPVSTPIDIIN